MSLSVELSVKKSIEHFGSSVAFASPSTSAKCRHHQTQSQPSFTCVRFDSLTVFCFLIVFALSKGQITVIETNVPFRLTRTASHPHQSEKLAFLLLSCLEC